MSVYRSTDSGKGDAQVGRSTKTLYGRLMKHVDEPIVMLCKNEGNSVHKILQRMRWQIRDYHFISLRTCNRLKWNVTTTSEELSEEGKHRKGANDIENVNYDVWYKWFIKMKKRWKLCIWIVKSDGIIFPNNQRIFFYYSTVTQMEIPSCFSSFRCLLF